MLPEYRAFQGVHIEGFLSSQNLSNLLSQGFSAKGSRQTSFHILSFLKQNGTLHAGNFTTNSELLVVSGTSLL